MSEEHNPAIVELGDTTHLLCNCSAMVSSIYKGARAVEDDEDFDGRGTE